MIKFFAAVLIVLSGPAAMASECYPSLSLDDARAVQSVFVFQVASAEFRRGAESPMDNFVLAKLRVIDPLRGKPSTYMSYYLGLHCGPRINVGSFYAALLPSNSGGFVGSASNLVVIGQSYIPTEDRPRLERLLQGSPDAQAILDSSWARLAQIPPPPPPCPPKGPRHGP